MNNQVMFSSERDDWQTPKWLFDRLNVGFTIDLCAQDHNKLVDRYCNNVQSGLLVNGEKIDWLKEIFFCNPPYGREIKGVLEAIPVHARGVLLVPSRTGSRWFCDLVKKCNEVWFLRGRLKFGGAQNSAPFDSAICCMGVKLDLSDLGWTL